GIILTIWFAVAIFNSSEFYQRVVKGGREQPWIEVLAYQLSASLTWAVFTPFIIALAERLPLEKPYALRNALATLSFIPAIAVLRAAVGGVINELADQHVPSLEFIEYSISRRFHTNVTLVVVIAGVTHLILAQRAAAARERNALALRTAVTNAELQRLRASMQPRMMFAILDAIADKVTKDAAVADEMIVHLGDLLRTMLHFSKRPFLTLSDELDVIDRYFELEKMRTSGAFTTRVDVEEDLLPARVPPLLLHALIESALLGNDPGSPHRLEIHGRTDNDRLIIEVQNDHVHRTPPSEALDETRARLQQAFGNDATLTWRREDGRIVTELTMPLQSETAA
ncbi:MAG TPA: histidine kinase, partial [Thermoanaerobaculia bacterium]